MSAFNNRRFRTSFRIEADRTLVYMGVLRESLTDTAKQAKVDEFVDTFKSALRMAFAGSFVAQTLDAFDSQVDHINMDLKALVRGNESKVIETADVVAGQLSHMKEATRIERLRDFR